MRIKKIKGFKPIKIPKKIKKIIAKEGTWIQDPKGFFLLKPDYKNKNKTIRLGYCTNDNILKYEIIGKRAQEVYYTIVRMKLVSKLEHAAYLGKELKKVELAIKYKLKYVQDKDLDFDKKVK